MLLVDLRVGLAVEQWLCDITKAATDEQCAGEVIVGEIVEDLVEELVQKSF